jgi:RNA polymerase sigma factor (sigma-70 family)
MTDQELIGGIIRRDRDAMQYLVSRYQEEVIKTAYYFTGDMADAEDLSQDVFLEVIRSAGSFKAAAALSTWIRRITINKALNHLKRQKRRSIVMRLETLFSDTKNGWARNNKPLVIQNKTEEEEEHKLLHKAIDRLPANQRIALILSKFDERSHREISEIMSISVSSVESLIHRAKKNLQRMLIHHFSEYRKE